MIIKRVASFEILGSPIIGWLIFAAMLAAFMMYDPSSCSDLLIEEEYVRCMDAQAENPGRPW